jgi:hypothetical protein
MIIEPPDAYFASVVGGDFVNKTILPAGGSQTRDRSAPTDGRFRTAANVRSTTGAYRSIGV